MKIAFFDTKPIEEEYLRANNNGLFEGFYYKESLNEAQKIEDEIKDTEGISVFISSDLSKKVLEKFKNLKFIFLRSVGYSHVDLFYTRENNIAVFNAPHYGDHSIAEYTFALLLSVSRKIIPASLDVKTQSIVDTNYQGVQLFKKTIGVVGIGAIGKKVVEIAKAMGMNVLCYDIIQSGDYNFVSLDELCQKSDIISINCPLTSDTLHLFDRNRFEIMKNGVIIINTARGEIINTIDLYRAVISKKVSFAALDVTECENVMYEDKTKPLDIDFLREGCLKNYYVTRKLLNFENVLITPHIAYNTKEAQKRILEITVENIISSTKFTNGAKNLVLI